MKNHYLQMANEINNDKIEKCMSCGSEDLVLYIPIGSSIGGLICKNCDMPHVLSAQQLNECKSSLGFYADPPNEK